MINEISWRRRALRGLAGLALLSSTPFAMSALAGAQAYPTRHVTLVVGYAAGGTGDVIARLIGNKLSEALGKSVVVENRAGASGGIAAGAVARAEPDGHTILVGQSAEIAINPHIVKGLTYNPDKDLMPIALAAVVPLGLVVPAKSPYTTVAELVAGAKASKQGLAYASAGAGTPSHFAGEFLRSKTQGTITHVPYKGAGPALNDILGGHVDLYFPGLPAAMPHVRSGSMKLLAVSTAKRSAGAPDVPTVAETIDAPGFDITLWVGFFAPRGTPKDIVGRLNEEINKILAQSDVKGRLLAEGADVEPMSVDRFAAFVKAESDKYAEMTKQTGIKAE